MNILPIISKIIERAIYVQIEAYINSGDRIDLNLDLRGSLAMEIRRGGVQNLKIWHYDHLRESVLENEEKK